MDKEFDVFGIGSPLMDIYLEAEDHHLIELKLKKGRMHLIEHKDVKNNQKKVKKKPKKTDAGGDIPNTMMGIAKMGGNTVFCGKVGKDGYADKFEEVLLSDNVKPVLSKCDKSYTGQVVAFVTKDAQRTFTTHVGAAFGLKKEEAVFEDLKKSKFLYTSAYVLDSKDLKETVYHAFEIAKKSNVKIAFDLADVGVISRHRDEIKDIIEDFVDVLFANEQEAKEFTGKNPMDALIYLSEFCDVTVVKLGKKGSLVKKDDEIIDFKINKKEAVDSTGAGDMYAAGFLFGLCKTDDLGICAEIASYASAKIVLQYGARLEKPIRKDVEEILKANIEK